MRDDRPFSIIVAERHQQILARLREILAGSNDWEFELVTSQEGSLNQNYRDPYVKLGRRTASGPINAAFRFGYRESEMLTLIPENWRRPELDIKTPNRFKVATLTVKKLEEWTDYISLLDEQYRREQAVKTEKRDAARALFDSLEGDHKYDQMGQHFVVERLGLSLLINRETGRTELQVPYGADQVALFRAVKSQESLNRVAFNAKHDLGNEDIRRLLDGGF